MLGLCGGLQRTLDLLELVEQAGRVEPGSLEEWQVLLAAESSLLHNDIKLRKNQVIEVSDILSHALPLWLFSSPVPQSAWMIFFFISTT